MGFDFWFYIEIGGDIDRMVTFIPGPTGQITWAAPLKGRNLGEGEILCRPTKDATRRGKETLGHPTNDQQDKSPGDSLPAR